MVMGINGGYFLFFGNLSVIFIKLEVPRIIFVFWRIFVGFLNLILPISS